MNLNPFAWLRKQISDSLADLEKLDQQIDAMLISFSEKSTRPDRSPDPASATPPTFVPLKAHGFVYYENTRDGFGWITRKTMEDPYQCLYCDGHRKEIVYRGSQKHARAWMEQFYQ